jgi:hypothetical protein
MVPHIAIVAILGPALLGVQDNPASLRLFTSQEGGFSLLLPDTPHKRVTSTPGEPPQIQFYIKRANGVYLASYVPNDKMKDADDDTVDRGLRKGQKTVQAQFGAKLVSEKKIKLDGKYPGREFVLELPMKPKGRLLRSRIYAVNGVQYQIILVGEKAFAESDEADRVLKSFRLKK